MTTKLTIPFSKCPKSYTSQYFFVSTYSLVFCKFFDSLICWNRHKSQMYKTKVYFFFSKVLNKIKKKVGRNFCHHTVPQFTRYPPYYFFQQRLLEGIGVLKCTQTHFWGVFLIWNTFGILEHIWNTTQNFGTPCLEHLWNTYFGTLFAFGTLLEHLWNTFPFFIKKIFPSFLGLFL